MLAAAALAVILAAIFTNHPGLLVPVLIAVLAALAALIPLPGEHAGQSAGSFSPDSTAYRGLTASEFAGALDDPVIFFDREGRVIEANAAAIAAFGPMSPGFSIPLKFRGPEVRGFVDRLIAGEAPAPIDFVERLPVERLFRLSGSTVGGTSDVIAIVFRDQSEVRRIDRMRADFIANASHELRTPLASISGFIETLRGSARNDARARDQFLSIMHAQAGRMARLLDDLLSLSRLEMKPRIDSTSTVDVREVVDRVIDAISPVATEAKVVIEKRIEATDTSVAGDPDELFQVVENLMENACKYGQSGGQVLVRIAPGQSGPRPEIDLTVTDFGKGIAAEHIPRLTERFYRVENQSSQKGTGLGLAIVKHIVARHGGRLTVKSELGKGSSFTVHFPVGGKAAAET